MLALIPTLISLLLCTAAGEITYVLDPSFPERPLPKAVEGTTAAAFDPRFQEVYVLQRGLSTPPVMVYDTSGVLKRSWGGIGENRSFEREHGIYIQPNLDEPDKVFVWITDVNGHTVSKFDREGNLLVQLGQKGIAGHSLHPLQFGNVADVASDKSGNIYISDGDGGVNNRVIKLDRHMNLVWSVGLNVTGTGPAQFESPHSIAYHERLDHLIIADRENNRTQFLSAATGAYIGEWRGNGDCEPVTPWSVRVDELKQLLIVVDGAHQPGTPYYTPDPHFGGRLMVFDLANFDASDIPACGPALLGASPIGWPVSEPHEIGYDAMTGDVYVAYVNDRPAVNRYLRK